MHTDACVFIVLNVVQLWTRPINNDILFTETLHLHILLLLENIVRTKDSLPELTWETESQKVHLQSTPNLDPVTSPSTSSDPKGTVEESLKDVPRETSAIKPVRNTTSVVSRQSEECTSTSRGPLHKTTFLTVYVPKKLNESLQWRIMRVACNNHLYRCFRMERRVSDHL